MIPAVSFLSKQGRSLIGDKLAEAARHFNIDLRRGHRAKDWREQFRSAKNVATWGLKIPVSEYIHRNDVLFIENALLAQRDGIWIDENGWFNQSAICKNKEFHQPATPNEVKKLQSICNRYFCWDLFEGHNKNGMLIHPMQRGSDASVKFYFPYKTEKTGGVFAGLDFLNKYGPEYPTIIRQHPRASNVKDFGPKQFKTLWKTHWTADRSNNVYDILRNCCGLIATNSTLVTEALTLGMKVATLGYGAFTGANVTFECADDPTKLIRFLDWEGPKQQDVLNYLCAVLRHQISYEDDVDIIANNQSFKIWASRL